MTCERNAWRRWSISDVCGPGGAKSAASQVCHRDGSTSREHPLDHIQRCVQCTVLFRIVYCMCTYSVPALPGAHIDRIILTVPQFNDDICSKNSVAQLLGFYADGGRRQDINVDLVHVHCAQH